MVRSNPFAFHQLHNTVKYPQLLRWILKLSNSWRHVASYYHRYCVMLVFGVCVCVCVSVLACARAGVSGN